MNHRRMPTVAVVGAIVLGACGDPGNAPVTDRQPSREELEAVWAEAQPIIDAEVSKEEGRSALQFPCGLYDKEAASALLSAEIGSPGFAREYKTRDRDSWQADACSWSSLNGGPSLGVWVSRPRHFAMGGVQCFGMEGEQTESSYGGQILWVFQGSFAWSKLLVCRDDALFEIEIHRGPGDEVAARELTDRIALHAINSL